MAAETEEVKVTCPECGHEVGTKEGGTKIKVHKVAGERCEGSESEVPSSDTDPEGLDKGDPFEALESDEDDEQGPNDDEDPADENGAQTDAQSSEDGGQFVHVIKVYNPCPYLGDQTWHAENAKVAAKAAQTAGRALAGAEPKHTKTEDHGSYSLVHYSVAVK